MENKELELGKKPIPALFERQEVKQKFNALLGNRATTFIMGVLQITSDKSLRDADPSSVYMAALLGASIDLPINKNLGWAYIVPFKNRKSGKLEAQFQLGYKGYIQLAHRSGEFTSISVTEIYEGQIVKIDPLEGDLFDFSKKGENVVGYAAYFSLKNGFKKTVYWDKKKVVAHASKFSQTFKQGYGIWADNFDAMAKKTVLKHILSAYAPLSIDMRTALITDQSVVKDAETMDVEYVDNTNSQKESEIETVAMFLKNIKTIQELMKCKEQIPTECIHIYEERFFELSESKTV